MKRVFLVPLVIVLISGLLFGGCAQPAPAPAPAPTPAEPIKLRIVSSLPEVTFPVKPLLIFRDKVNERAKGALTIEYLGGPEIIDAGDQAISVQKGVLEMAYTFSGAYVGLVPGADAFTLSRVSLAEERSRGAYDFLQPQYAKNNLYLLGRLVSGVQGEYFYVATTKPVKRLSDMVGLKIASFSPALIHFFEAIGGSGPVIGPPDIYTAVERGTVDGAWLPVHDHVTFGLIEVEKTLIDHGFCSDNFTVYLNLDTWNGLPKNLQDLLTQALIDTQNEFQNEYIAQNEQDREDIRNAGIEFVKFPPDEAEKFVNTAFEAEWEDMIQKYPDIGAKLKELLYD